MAEGRGTYYQLPEQQPSEMLRSVAVGACAGCALYFLASTVGISLWQVPSPVKPSQVLGVHTTQPIRASRTHQHAFLSESQQGFTTSDAAAPLSSVLWEGNTSLATAAALGTVLGAGLVALYQRFGQTLPSEDAWSLAAVSADAAGSTDGEATPKPLPPYAGKERFRPDLFQPLGKPGTIPFTSIPYQKTRRLWFNRTYNGTDWVFLVTTFVMHAVAFILGPMTYRPDCLALAAAMWVVTGMFGITLSFHRQLSHKAFATPKWLEYLFAYCGVLAIQGDPLEWVSSHRYHHLYTETDRDPHTVNEGLWWSHMGWLLDNTATKARTGDQTNAPDIMNDPFYKFIGKTYPIHLILFGLAMYAWGGLPYLVWGVAVRTVWVWHITWFVNSASHAWGTKKYKTNPPDESRNNWWVGLLAFGEGWHNNHHAFQYSARHGLEWWQIDPTWYTIRFLQFLGLAWDVKLPTEARKAAALL